MAEEKQEVQQGQESQETQQEEQKPKVTKAELLKMPVPKLREVALAIEGLQGVHGMSKEELIRAIAEHYNIDLSDRPEFQVDTRAIKAKIKELRALLVEVRAQGDKKKAEILRKRIKRLKRKIRWR